MIASRKYSSLRSRRGSALLAALIFAAVLALALSSYLALCYQTLKTSSRGTQSNHSIELAETGMENALWSINNNDWTGWTVDNSTSPHVATRTMTGSDFNYDNGVTGTITLTVTNYDSTTTAPFPTIKSVGTTTLADGTTVSRALQTQSPLARAALFTNALAANQTSGTVNFSSGTFTVDSYDSSAGAYNSASPGYSAIVTGSSVTLANGSTVDGYVTTPPTSSGALNMSYGTTSLLKGPTTAGTLKIDSTRQSTSPYQPLFDVTAPSAATSISAPTGVYHIGTAGATTPTTINGTLDSNGLFDIENSGNLVIDGPIKLVVNGYFYVGPYSGSGKITVANWVSGAAVTAGGTGYTSTPTVTISAPTLAGGTTATATATLSLSGSSVASITITSIGSGYTSTPTITISGGGGSGAAATATLTSATFQAFVSGYTYIAGSGIDNTSKIPKNVSIFGTGSYSGYYCLFYTGTPFYGAVDTPNADVYLYGYNNSSAFYGSMIGRNVYPYPYSSTSLALHYDKDLRNAVFPNVGSSTVGTPLVVQAGSLTETSP